MHSALLLRFTIISAYRRTVNLGRRGDVRAYWLLTRHGWLAVRMRRPAPVAAARCGGGRRSWRERWAHERRVFAGQFARSPPTSRGGLPDACAAPPAAAARSARSACSPPPVAPHRRYRSHERDPGRHRLSL